MSMISKTAQARLAALVIAFTFMSVVSTGTGWAATQTAAEKLVAKKAAIIANMHKKASKALVTSAQDKIFARYFTGHTEAKASIKKLSLNVQRRFHVEEMCLIDPKGHEISRIVADKITPDEDLSTEEAAAPFFAPSFAQKHRHTHVAYMSPDADKWAIAYVTPIVVAGKKEAILHYEHTVEAYQTALNRGMKPENGAVPAVSAEGYVISDSRKQINLIKKNGSEAIADYFEKLPRNLAAIVTIGGNGAAILVEDGAQYPIAYRTIHDWTIIAIAK